MYASSLVILHLNPWFVNFLVLISPCGAPSSAYLTGTKVNVGKDVNSIGNLSSLVVDVSCNFPHWIIKPFGLII